MGIFSDPEPQTYDVAGGQLKCIICGNDQFDTREAQLHTAGMTFLGLDWANRSAYCVVCANCGYIHWFLPH